MIRFPNLRPFALAALVAGALGALMSGCSSHKDSAEARTATVARLAPADVATVTRADVSAGIPVSGTLEPAVDVRMTAPMSEVLESVLVREGQAVSKGQVLARFRTSALGAGAASAEAELKMRRADHERMKNLLKEGAVSERDVESAEAAWRAADAAYVSARRQLEDATVRAPVAGVVAERSIQGGDRIADGDPMFRLVNTRELEFEATVPGEFAGSIVPGAPVSLSTNGVERVIEGRVARVNATADPATRQVQVYVRVANTNGALVGGLFASGSIVTRDARGVIAIATGAIRGNPESPFVLVVENDIVGRKTVTIGVRDEARELVEITSGLGEGDRVVVGPIEGLEVGRPVTIGADSVAAVAAGGPK